jgi:hypothetical protein
LSVTVKTTTAGVVVEVPFDPAWPLRAREINGKPRKDSNNVWTWTFDPRDEDAVRNLLVEIYGTDGRDADEPTVTVRMPMPDSVTKRTAGEMRVAGRRLVWRPGRDTDVRYADGVVLVSGGFPGQGGSVRYPALAPNAGTVVEVRDVPRGQAVKMLEEVPGATIVSDQPVDERRAVLVRRRDELLAELAEVNALLDAEVEERS